MTQKKVLTETGLSRLVTLINGKYATKDTATTSANGLMSSTDKTKLNGIAANANNYTHPNTVTAGTVGTSSATSGVTLAVPYVTYNANGHITATGTHTHTVSGMTGASADAAGTTGLVPAPAKGDQTKFLRADGTWQAANNYSHPSDGSNTGSFGPSANASPAHGAGFSVPYITVNAAGHVTAASTKTITLPAQYSHPTSGVTAASYGPSANASPAHGGTFSVPYVTVDANGHITAASTKTITLPTDNNTDTKVTNTLGTTTKFYVTGTTSATTNTGTQYFDTGVYVSATAGELVATKFTGALNGKANDSDKLGGTAASSYALKSYVDTAVANIVNSAPETLDTLSELSAALGDDPNFATTIATQIGSKVATGSADYIKSASVSGKTLTLTKGDDTTVAFTETNTTYSAGSGLSLSGTTFNHASTVTAGTAGTSSATSGITLAVPYVTYNATGHVTAAGTHTHTVPNMTAASASAAGAAGLVPAPAKGDQAKFLRADGTWQAANNYSHPSDGANTGSFGPSDNASPAHGGTFSVPYFTVNAAGHVTAASTKTITLPADNDTKNTAGSTNSTAKLFLVGAASQAANSQTYSSSKVYETDGALVATSFSGSGTSLTSLNASNISSGTLAAARLAASGVTAGSYGPSADVTGSHNATISVPYITVDTYGRVTSIANKTYTSKNDNTTYSAGTTAQLVAGTDTANRVWPAKQIADYVKPRSIEFIKGTQTAATNAFTGATVDSALYDGKTIMYFLPYAGTSTAATLNLTLADGTTTTGAKAVKYIGTSGLTTHYAAGSVICLTYVEDQDQWRSADYANSNTYDRVLHNSNIKAASAITKAFIIVGDSAGYKNVASGATFDITYPILYASAAINASATAKSAYDAFPDVNLAITKASWTGTQYAVAFLVGTLSGNTFTIDSSVFTTTIPSTADGKIYIPLGVMSSTTAVYFNPTGDMYQYTNGSFHLYDRAPGITNITRSGTTFTATKSDGSTFTFTQQDSDTKYSAGTGISLSGTTFSNSGVRSIATGSTNGTISVNTNGTNADIAVKGLGTAAYTASSDYVNLTSNQTITGTKTFKYLSFKNDAATKGTNPSTEKYPMWISVYDSEGTANSNRLGALHVTVNTNGNVNTGLYAYKNEAGITSAATLNVVYPKTGNPYATAPTPDANDDSTKIATTAFVKNAITTGSANGTISVSGSNVAVKGLGSAAYTASTAYAGASHTHTKIDISKWLLANTPSENVPSNQDLNNLTTAGIYTTSGGSGGSTTVSTLVNKPSDLVCGCQIWVICTDIGTGTNYKQIIFAKNGVIYERHYTGSEWTAWVKILNENSTLNAAKLSGLTKAQVTTALGYTPPTTDTKYTHPSAGANTGSFGPSANASPAHGGTFSVPYLTVNSDGHVTAISTKTITLPAAPAGYTHPSEGTNTGSFGPSADKSPEHGGTFSVPYITVNAAGHVTAASTKVITLPRYSAATTYTAGLMSASDKMKLDGIQTVDYLHLNGGTMTGNITWNRVDTRLKKSNDDGTMALYGGTNWNTSPSLTLYGSSYANYTGSFDLSAHDGTTQKQLIGKPDGTLTWDNNQVATFNSDNALVFPDGTQMWIENTTSAA